jgi:hypothetical protein
MAAQQASEQQPGSSQQRQVQGDSQEPREQTEKPAWLGTSKEHCQEMVDRARNRDPMVKFMLQKMEEVR